MTTTERDIKALATLEGLTRASAAMGWDLHPELFLYVPEEGLDFDESRLVMLPTEGWMWETGHPVDVIRTITGLLREHGGPEQIPAAYFRGVVLLNEGWGLHLSEKENSPEEIAQAMEDAEKHNLHLRTDKQEVKMATLITAEDDYYAVTLFRESDTVDKMGPIKTGGDPDTHGRVPAVVRELLAAFREMAVDA